MEEDLVSRLQQAQQALVAVQGEFLAAWAKDAQKPEIVLECDGAAEAREIEALAGEIMQLIEREAGSRTVAGMALTRAVAGFWARLAYDFQEPPVVASIGLLIPAADVAGRLVQQRLDEDRPLDQVDG
jgi:hypothetical protein